MDDADLRISDSDRDGVADLLRNAHAEGRVDAMELTARLDAVWSARTYRDLRPVVADLPRFGSPSAWDSGSVRPAPVTPPAGAVVSPVPRSGMARRAAQGAIRASWMVWTGVVSINVVIWAIILVTTGETAGFWPLWVAGPWGAVLGVVTVAERRTRPGPASRST